MLESVHSDRAERRARVWLECSLQACSSVPKYSELVVGWMRTGRDGEETMVQAAYDSYIQVIQ